ncbi:MAG TPA: DUF3592 domain-containing protein [Syntrophorhabdaceae bacterium]|nr:DUF3592 domain-containing protein [Syntrophorhabdaceae bacterium]
MTKRAKGRNWMLLFVLGGLVVLVYGISLIYEAISSYTWPVCKGKIITSEVSLRKNIKGGSIDKTYTAHVIYEYNVNDILFTNDRIFWGQYNSGIKSLMQNIVDKYPVGKEVSVYYDPRKPKNAVLERNINWATIAIPFFGLIFITIGFIGFKYWDLLNKTQESVKREDLS